MNSSLQLLIITANSLSVLTRRELFRKFNEQQKVSGHEKCSANKLYYNNRGELFAIRCNCGVKSYHPVYGDKVVWGQKIAVNILQIHRKKPAVEALAYLDL